MIRWLKKHTVARRCRKPKTEKALEDPVHNAGVDFLNHTYEEIPDVIPAVWRGIRSDSVPSFFLVGTSGFTDSEDSITEPCQPYSVVSLSEDSYSYETPTSSVDSGEELDKLGQLLPFASEADTSTDDEDVTDDCTDSQVYSYCSRDKLSCVRASCDHSHPETDSSGYGSSRTLDNHRGYRNHSDTVDTVSLTTVSSLYSLWGSEDCVSSVYSDDMCVSDADSDDICVSDTDSVKLKSSIVKPKMSAPTKTVGRQNLSADVKRNRRYSTNGVQPRLVNSRNRLLDDLIRSNYDKRMTAF